MSEYLKILKMNPNHDENGLFAKAPSTGPGAPHDGQLTGSLVKKLNDTYGNTYKVEHRGDNKISVQYESTSPAVANVKLSQFVTGGIAKYLKGEHTLEARPTTGVLKLSKKGPNGQPIYAQNFALVVAGKG